MTGYRSIITMTLSSFIGNALYNFQRMYSLLHWFDLRITCITNRLWKEYCYFNANTHMREMRSLGSLGDTTPSLVAYVCILIITSYSGISFIKVIIIKVWIIACTTTCLKCKINFFIPQFTFLYNLDFITRLLYPYFIYI